MSTRIRITAFGLLLTGLLPGVSLPRTAAADLTQTALSLAAPLAEQFGVPASGVTALLEDGLSIESVTELLLIGQSSDKGLEEVTEAYRSQGDDIAKTAEALEVDASAYSTEKVNSVIEEAKTSLAAKAADSATEGTSKALGDALGGIGR